MIYPSPLSSSVFAFKLKNSIFFFNKNKIMDIELQKIKIFIISKVGKNWVIIQSKVYKNKY